MIIIIPLSLASSGLLMELNCFLETVRAMLLYLLSIWTMYVTVNILKFSISSNVSFLPFVPTLICLFLLPTSPFFQLISPPVYFLCFITFILLTSPVLFVISFLLYSYLLLSFFLLLSSHLFSFSTLSSFSLLLPSFLFSSSPLISFDI